MKHSPSRTNQIVLEGCIPLKTSPHPTWLTPMVTTEHQHSQEILPTPSSNPYWPIVEVPEFSTGSSI